MVGWLYNFYSRVEYIRGSESYNIRMRSINMGGISKGDFIFHCHLTMTLKDKLCEFYRRDYFKSEKYQLDRISKIDNTYESCVDDKFIEVVKDDIIRVSNNGSDLLHCLGFINISLKKYSTLQVFVLGLFSSALVILVISLILKYRFNITL